MPEYNKEILSLPICPKCNNTKYVFAVSEKERALVISAITYGQHFAYSACNINWSKQRGVNYGNV